MNFSPEDLRRRFAELTAQRNAILKASAPLRAERDAVFNEAREKELALNVKIREIEKDHSDICNEMGLISRTLGGKTGG